MVETRERILQLLRDGKTGAEIARTLTISKPAVSKHVSKLVEAGLWVKPERAEAQVQSSPPSSQKQNPKPRGGPIGNKKGLGNRGNRNASAPRGNKNAVRTGAYETIFADTLDDDELEIYLGIDTTAVKQAEEEVRLLTIRERRMMQRIAALKTEPFTTVEESEDEETAASGENENRQLVVKSRRRSWKRQGTLGQIQSIEEALTRVQERKRSALELLHKLRDGGVSSQPDVGSYVDALNATAGDVWAGENPEADDGEGGDSE